MSDKTTAVAITPPAANPTVPVKLKISGTKGGAFRFTNGVLEQYQLDDIRELTHEQAKLLAEFYIAMLGEK